MSIRSNESKLNKKSVSSKEDKSKSLSRRDAKELTVRKDRKEPTVRKDGKELPVRKEGKESTVGKELNDRLSRSTRKEKVIKTNTTKEIRPALPEHVSITKDSKAAGLSNSKLKLENKSSTSLSNKKQFKEKSQNGISSSTKSSGQSKEPKSIKGSLSNINSGDSRKNTEMPKDKLRKVSSRKPSSRGKLRNEPDTTKSSEKLKGSSSMKVKQSKSVSKGKDKIEKIGNTANSDQPDDIRRGMLLLNTEPIKTETSNILPISETIHAERIATDEISGIAEEFAKEPSDGESRIVDPAHNSLETLESGISMTTQNDLSDAEVEESFSSRLVEVDELEMNDYPSLPLSMPQHAEPEINILDSEQYYDDDFENYESDFDDEDDEDGEEDNSKEDESEEDEEEGYLSDKDSYNREMEEIVRAMEAENNHSKYMDMDNSSRNQAPQDPYKKNEDEPIKPILKTSRPKTGRAFVNFANAKERARVEKASEKLKNRGQILQEMIQLDTISIELFTQLPDSYEAYISAFGNANSFQVSVQTNEDDLSEFVQTDNPQSVCKWTQHPISVSSDISDYSGVGGDTIDSSDKDAYADYLAVASDSGRLTKFLDASSQVILQLLEEDAILDEENDLGLKDNTSLGFSKSGFLLGLGLQSLLEGRLCTLVSFCPYDSSLILTGHGFKNNSETDDQQKSSSKERFSNDTALDSSIIISSALVCLWSVHQPKFPKVILNCRSPALVSCFSPKRPVVVISGLQDGSLSAWDLRESISNHPFMVSLDNSEWRLRSPSFITACSPEDTTEGSQIIALQTLAVDDETSHDGSFQVVSLSSCGQLTWWVLVQESQPLSWGNDPTVATHVGAAPWSKIALSRATTLSLVDSLDRENFLGGSTYCYDMKLAKNDQNLLYVATANGNVLHCSRHNMKVHPSTFSPAIGPGSEAVSISVCPHDSQYFLVGGSDGLIRLHSVSLPLPLTCWQATINPAPIKKIQWSQSRPCVFYMLDNLGMLHIWDLSAGDIYPTISVEEGKIIEGQLTNFDLTSDPYDKNHPVYIVFTNEKGSVQIRSISSQYLRKNKDEYTNELHRFKCYVNII